MMHHKIYTDSEPKIVLIWKLCGIMVFILCIQLIGVIQNNSLSIIPIWAAWFILYILITAYVLIMLALPFVRIKILSDSLMIAEYYFGNYNITIPYRVIISVHAYEEPAVEFIHQRLGLRKFSMVIHKIKNALIPNRKGEFEIHIGSRKGQTLFIETTTLKYIISCPDAITVASAIKQLWGITENSTDVET
jgi:hypothetical protein